MGERIANERQAREIAAYLDDPELLERIVQRAINPEWQVAYREGVASGPLGVDGTPSQAKDARAVYRVAEYTAELEREWQEGAVRFVGNFVNQLPPEQWPLAFGVLQADPPQGREAQHEKFRAMLVKIAFDAPLTDRWRTSCAKAPR